MSQENTALVRSAYEAYNRRDREAIGRFFEGLKPYLGEDHQVAIGELIDADDRVVALVRHQGTAPGGERYEVPSIMVWTAAGGKLTALYEQLDTLAMARATEGAPA